MSKMFLPQQENGGRVHGRQFLSNDACPKIHINTSRTDWRKVEPMNTGEAEVCKLVLGFDGVPTSIISDSLERLPGTGELRPMHSADLIMLGTAYTVHTAPGDNLAIHEAFKCIMPGQVLVVDGGGDRSRALIGGLMLAMAEEAGVAGLVIDGVVRDGSDLAASRIPVFARGLNHRGPFKNGPGRQQVPVAIGGMVVHPGDVIVGDIDGLVSFSIAGASELLESCKARIAMEARILEDIRSGAAQAYGSDEQRRK